MPDSVSTLRRAHRNYAARRISWGAKLSFAFT